MLWPPFESRRSVVRCPLQWRRLTVAKPGFQTTAVTGITTSLGRVNTVNPVLKLGTVSTEVEVTTEAFGTTMFYGKVVAVLPAVDPAARTG